MNKISGKVGMIQESRYKELLDAEKQRDILLLACRIALQWAAGFPLGIASTEADRLAANVVYQACSDALSVVNGSPKSGGGKNGQE